MYYLFEFDNLGLPPGLPTDSLNLQAKTNITPFKRGAFNGDGSSKVGHQGQSITHSGIIHGPSIESDYDAILAKVGVSGPLWRKRKLSGVRQWTNATFNGENATMTIGNSNNLPVSLAFTQTSPVWYGATQTIINEGILANGQNIIVPNNGNAVVANPIITLTISSQLSFTINSITLAIPGKVNLSVSGSFIANDIIIIEAGSWKITHNGVFINDFTTTTDHKVLGLIEFEPKDNVLVISSSPALPTLSNIIPGMYMGPMSPMTYSTEFQLGSINLNISLYDGWH